MPLHKERPKKRELIRWSHDEDMVAFLAIPKVVAQDGIKINWDKVAAFVGPTVTGNALIQHMAKLIKKRKQQGLPVPEDDDDSNPSYVGPKGGKGKQRGKALVNSGEDPDEDNDETDMVLDPEGSSGTPSLKRVKRGKSGAKVKMEDMDEDDPLLYEFKTKRAKGPRSQGASGGKRKAVFDYGKMDESDLEENIFSSEDDAIPSSAASFGALTKASKRGRKKYGRKKPSKVIVLRLNTVGALAPFEDPYPLEFGYSGKIGVEDTLNHQPGAQTLLPYESAYHTTLPYTAGDSISSNLYGNSPFSGPSLNNGPSTFSEQGLQDANSLAFPVLPSAEDMFHETGLTAFSSANQIGDTSDPFSSLDNNNDPFSGLGDSAYGSAEAGQAQTSYAANTSNMPALADGPSTDEFGLGPFDYPFDFSERDAFGNVT